MKWILRPIQTVLVAGLVLLVGPLAPWAGAQGKKTFVAYSMPVAQTRVEDAMRKGEDFRRTQPDLFYLGGITKPWAVVLDTQTGDWILVGERDPKAAVLTLDDWVVALRTRFIHVQQDPGVTIDPIPSTACLQAGRQGACADATQQAVRFFGGIEDTHFGQVCFAADWLLKRISLGLEKGPGQPLRTAYDLAVAQRRREGGTPSRVASRFWFYPIVSRVNVLGDVVLLEQLQMGVFTEVLYAEVNGTPVADVSTFEHYPTEGFARLFSEHYDAAAEVWEVFETLRGLTRLAALAQGLTQVAAQPPMDFYLTRYLVQPVQTPRAVDVLRVENREVGLQFSGGAQLMALVMRLQGGDVGALRELVLGVRPTAKALRWEFEGEIRAGQLAGIRLPTGLGDPSDIGPLFQHAVFLHQKGRYKAAMEGYDQVLQRNPTVAEAYHGRGDISVLRGHYDQAIADYTQALRINSRLATAYNNRGVAYANRGHHDQAIADYTQALGINPRLATAYNNRGVAYRLKGHHDQALADYTQALGITPTFAKAHVNRAEVYLDKGQYDYAIADLTQALEFHPGLAVAYTNRGIAYRRKGHYDQALADLNKALAIDARVAQDYLAERRSKMFVTDIFTSFHRRP